MSVRLTLGALEISLFLRQFVFVHSCIEIHFMWMYLECFYLTLSFRHILLDSVNKRKVIYSVM